jgi:hypothetical protein
MIHDPCYRYLSPFIDHHNISTINITLKLSSMLTMIVPLLPFTLLFDMKMLLLFRIQSISKATPA